MKILLVTSDLSEGGGVTRVISNLAHIFTELPTLQVDVLHAKEFRGFRYEMPDTINLIIGRSYVRISSLNLLLNLVRARSERYDYVISFWTQENLLACLAFLFSHSKLIVCEHFSHYQAGRWIGVARRWLYRLAHKVLVLNSAEFLYYGQFFKNVELVANPVLRSPQGSSDYAEKQNLVIGVGHLTERKGFEYFIHACVRAKLADVGWRAVIIGDGPDREQLQNLIARYRAAHYIELIPATSRVEDWYRVAKVIVVPSLIEVFSMVIPEAMAHGVVPIAFAADGPKDILRQYQENLVPVKDVHALAVALGLATRDSMLSQKAAAFREEALSRYSHSALKGEWRRLLSLQGSQQ